MIILTTFVIVGWVAVMASYALYNGPLKGSDHKAQARIAERDARIKAEDIGRTEVDRVRPGTLLM